MRDDDAFAKALARELLLVEDRRPAKWTAASIENLRQLDIAESLRRIGAVKPYKRAIEDRD